MAGWLVAAGMTTSSKAVGTEPILQLEALIHSVLVHPFQMFPAVVVSTPVLLLMLLKVPPLRIPVGPTLASAPRVMEAALVRVPLFNTPDVALSMAICPPWSLLKMVWLIGPMSPTLARLPILMVAALV